jgi:hypothetical protein
VCNCRAIALKSLQNRFEFAEQSLHNRCAIDVKSP